MCVTHFMHVRKGILCHCCKFIYILGTSQQHHSRSFYPCLIQRGMVSAKHWPSFTNSAASAGSSAKRQKMVVAGMFLNLNQMSWVCQGF